MRESRHHLFTKFKAWAPQIRRLWMRIGKDCKWKHPKAPAVRHTRPGQQLARAAMEVHAHLVARDNEVTVHWVLAHSGILSNDGFA